MLSQLKMKSTKKSMDLSRTQIISVLILKQILKKLSVKLEEKYQRKRRMKILKNFQFKRRLLQKKWFKMKFLQKDRFQIQHWRYCQQRSFCQKAWTWLGRWISVMTRNSFFTRRCTELRKICCEWELIELFYLLNFLWYFVSLYLIIFFHPSNVK